VTAREAKSKFEAKACRRAARRFLLLTLSASFIAGAPSAAFASDAPAEAANDAAQRRSMAKGKYEQGVEAYRRARYADAVRLFLEADAISPSAALSYNIARAYEKLADDAQTLRWYRNYLRLEPRPKNLVEVQGYIRSLSEALARQGLQQLTILTSPPGATVTIDGMPLGVSPLTLELRPGAHDALLTRRGFSDFVGHFVLPQSTPIDVRAELQVAASNGLPTADTAREPGRRFGIAPYLTLGAAAVCLGSAAIFEISRRSAQNSAENERVQLDYARDIDAMNSRQTTARVLLGVGGVLAVTGATLLVFNTQLAPASRAVVAGIPGGATLALELRF